MDMTQVIDWSREALRMALLLGGPLLAAALLVGLLINVGQTLTQLHEPVVGLVPRLVAVAAGPAVDLALAAGPLGVVRRRLDRVDPGTCCNVRRFRVDGLGYSRRVDWAWVIEPQRRLGPGAGAGAGLCLTAPGLAVPGLDWRFRLVLAAMLGAVLSPVVAPLVVPPADWPGAAWAVPGGGADRRRAGLVGRPDRCRGPAAGELVAARPGSRPRRSSIPRPARS